MIGSEGNGNYRRAVADLQALGYTYVRTNGKGFRILVREGRQIALNPGIDEHSARYLVTDARAALGLRTDSSKRNPVKAKGRARASREKQSEAAREAESRRAELRREKTTRDAEDPWLDKIAEFKSKGFVATIDGWRLTDHALARMLQGQISAEAVYDALRAPQHVNVGADVPVFIGRKVKVTADPDRRLIITVTA